MTHIEFGVSRSKVKVTGSFKLGGVHVHKHFFFTVLFFNLELSFEKACEAHDNCQDMFVCLNSVCSCQDGYSYDEGTSNCTMSMNFVIFSLILFFIIN